MILVNKNFFDILLKMPDSSDEEIETEENDIKANSESDELSDSEMKKG